MLLSKGYEVHGIIRRASTFNTGRLDPIYRDPHAGQNRLFLHYGDLSDASALARLIGKVQPAEVYNLAAQSHSVREFLDQAFSHVGLDWKRHVENDPRYYRPAEVDLLVGDCSKARQELGWAPKTTFIDLVKLMVDADIQLLRDQRRREGTVNVVSTPCAFTTAFEAMMKETTQAELKTLATTAGASMA